MHSSKVLLEYNFWANDKLLNALHVHRRYPELRAEVSALLKKSEEFMQFLHHSPSDKLGEDWDPILLNTHHYNRLLDMLMSVDEESFSNHRLADYGPLRLEDLLLNFTLEQQAERQLLIQKMGANWSSPDLSFVRFVSERKGL